MLGNDNHQCMTTIASVDSNDEKKKTLYSLRFKKWHNSVANDGEFLTMFFIVCICVLLKKSAEASKHFIPMFSGLWSGMFWKITKLPT